MTAKINIGCSPKENKKEEKEMENDEEVKKEKRRKKRKGRKRAEEKEVEPTRVGLSPDCRCPMSVQVGLLHSEVN